MKNWGGKPYYSVDQYYKDTFGEKVYKISLNANLTCPNRDGTKDTRGCIFCSEGGSGDFTNKNLSITEQINSGIITLQKSKNTGNKYIAYFQAFTNTYGCLDYLRKIYFESLYHPSIVGISIATRPDCLQDEIIMLLSLINSYKPVSVELGLQTIHKKSADLIRRGYSLQCYESAVKKLQLINVDIVVHLILGLPNETKNNITNTVKYVAKSPINGVKLQLLHVLNKTDLANYYHLHPFHVLELEEYVNLIVDCIEILPKEIVIHRITGDGPRDLLIAPMWSLDKRKVLNSIHKAFKSRNTYQGKLKCDIINQNTSQ